MNTDVLNPSVFTNFLSMDLFMNGYQKFLGLFPSSVHWLVSLIVLISIIAAFVALIQTHWIFIVLAIILLPVIYPVLQSFFGGIWEFVSLLWTQVQNGIPKT